MLRLTRQQNPHQAKQLNPCGSNNTAGIACKWCIPVFHDVEECVRVPVQVMKTCAEGVRNVSLELGGKSPIIIFDDVNIDSAVEW